MAELSAKQGITHDLVDGHLDSWHGLVKMLEHADRLEQDPSSGLVSRYYRAARGLRRVGAFGEGQKVMRAVAKRLRESWSRPAAPQEGGTRTPLYEVDRVPPNLLRNFRVGVLGSLAVLEAHVRARDSKAAKTIRA